ncbi:TBC1 domain family member 12-like, partial [Orussus abietinus]|uniref:TBC1 domain family member 12-like n=1 Tax=Orussus abietinus TaxID=222816 RepID=UPI000C715D4D
IYKTLILDSQVSLSRSLAAPEEALVAIELDVARTFPALNVFREGGPLCAALKSVLAAYAVFRPDVGYVQGMSFLGAVLALNMEPADAFICLANMLNGPCHRAAYALDGERMMAYFEAYKVALAECLPRLHQHFVATGLTPDLYLLDWLYTVYAKAMPLDVASRVWDLFLRDGDEFLFKAALGVLHRYQDRLLDLDFVGGAQFLARLPQDMRADDLFRSIARVSNTLGPAFAANLAQRVAS